MPGLITGSWTIVAGDQTWPNLTRGSNLVELLSELLFTGPRPMFLCLLLPDPGLVRICWVSLERPSPPTDIWSSSIYDQILPPPPLVPDHPGLPSSIILFSRLARIPLPLIFPLICVLSTDPSHSAPWLQVPIVLVVSGVEPDLFPCCNTRLPWTGFFLLTHLTLAKSLWLSTISWFQRWGIGDRTVKWLPKLNQLVSAGEGPWG